MLNIPAPQFLKCGGIDIAYRSQSGIGTPILWCGGFKSDMLGGKAQAVSEWASNHNRPFLRFDYSGHGESKGVFKEGTISKWLNEAKAICALNASPPLIIGSSMGGWIALLLAQHFSLHGLVLIAPAPDFTQKLMWDGFSQEIKTEILEKGFWQRPSPYDHEGYPITKALIEDGLNHTLMGKSMITNCPVHILAGRQDEDVPLAHVLKLMNCFTQDEATLTIVPEGDHRLSREQDIALLLRVIDLFRHNDPIIKV